MKSIYVVIVLYKIDLLKAQSFKTLIEPHGIEEYLVYDNSPKAGYTDISKLGNSVTYVNDTNNSGLSAAYNKGAEIARQLGYSHVLLLDQDTHFEASVWQEYLNHLDYPGIVAPMMRTTTGADFSPVNISGLFTRAAHGLSSAEYSLTSYAVVNSGCCIPVDLFFKAGGYADKVRLDFADFQFQLRMRRVQPRFLLLNTVAIQDFSNDCRELSKVKARYNLYLESASHYVADGTYTRLQHICDVVKHTLSLTVRMRSLSFVRSFITNYLIK